MACQVCCSKRFRKQSWFKIKLLSQPGSSLRRCYIKKVFWIILKYSQQGRKKEKISCRSLFLIKFQAFRPAALLKRNSNTNAFLIAKHWRTPILKNICERLLLTLAKTKITKKLLFLIVFMVWHYLLFS